MACRSRKLHACVLAFDRGSLDVCPRYGRSGTTEAPVESQKYRNRLRKDDVADGKLASISDNLIGRVRMRAASPTSVAQVPSHLGKFGCIFSLRGRRTTR